MGLLDFLKKATQKTPLQKFQEAKEEIRDYTKSLQQLSEDLSKQLAQLQSLQNGDFIKIVDDTKKLMEKSREDISVGAERILEFDSSISNQNLDEIIKTANINLNVFNIMIEMTIKDTHSHLGLFNKVCSESAISLIKSEQLISELPKFTDKLSSLTEQIDSVELYSISEQLKKGSK